MADPRQPPSASTESGPTSPAARKGPLGLRVMLLALLAVMVVMVVGGVVLLGAYALGYVPQSGSLLEDAIRFSRSSDLPAVGTVFYGIAGLAAFLMLMGLLRCFDLLLRQFRDASPLKSRPAKPVEQFIAEAAALRISLRVARESYYLLEPQYPYRMCIDLGDDLRTDLRVPDEAIRALDAMLRARCDRRQAPVIPTTNSASDPATQTLVTVFDLLQATETALPSREDRSGSRDRAADGRPSSPASERRLSDSAQRKALHASTLSAIEAGSLHTPDSSGLHRRFNDYRGPRRRATDNRPDAEYNGPYQRATDRTQDRPPASSPERKAQPAAVPAELTAVDSVFASRRIRRTPESIR